MVFVQFLLETTHWLDEFGSANAPSVLFGSFKIVLPDTPWCSQPPASSTPAVAFTVTRGPGAHLAAKPPKPGSAGRGASNHSGSQASYCHSKPQWHREHREHCTKGSSASPTPSCPARRHHHAATELPLHLRARGAEERHVPEGSSGSSAWRCHGTLRGRAQDLTCVPNASSERRG